MPDILEKQKCFEYCEENDECHAFAWRKVDPASADPEVCSVWLVKAQGKKEKKTEDAAGGGDAPGVPT